MTMLDVSSLTAGYGDIPVLRGIDLRIDAGQFVAVLGRNGAGKSTTMRCIAGLHTPDSGTITLNGGEVTRERADERLRRGLAFVPEGRHLFPHLTVHDNLMVGGYTRRLKGTALRDAIDEATAHLPRVRERLAQLAGSLSGGEQQRVGLCRAVLLNPPLVLLDEAFSALDDETKNEIHEQLLSIQKAEPRTIVLVTHNRQEAEKLADSVFQIESKVLNKMK